MSRVALPVDEHLPRLLDDLRASGACVLVAPPGAGKTTRVPPALLDAGLAGEGAVVVLEPRRVAARAATARIAEERGGRVGDEVGYHVRLDRQACDDTRILAATYGPSPPAAGRGSVPGGGRCGGAGRVPRALAGRRPDARSAAAHAPRGSRRPGPGRDVGDARPRAARRVPGRTAARDRGPVAPGGGRAPRLPRRVGCDAGGRPSRRRRAERHRRRRAGLPARSRRDPTSRRGSQRSHGRRGRRTPRRPAARRPGPRAAERPTTTGGALDERRRDVGDRGRRDGGGRHGHGTDAALRSGTGTAGAPAGAESRARRRPSGPGAQDARDRAAASVSGPKSEHRLRPERETPEVRAADLADAYLLLVAAGEADPRSFEWFEAPGAERLSAARELLHELRALEDDRLTDRGRALADLPLPPRLGALLVDGHERGVLTDAALAAALLSGRDPFRGGDARHTSESDLLDRVDALAGRRSALGRPGRGARFTQQVAKQLRTQAERVLGRGKPVRQGHDRALRRAVLAAFPDRVARRREPGSSRGVMVGGRGVNLSPRSAVRDAPLFVCLDIGGERRGESVVHMASAVERDWLDETTTVDLAFDVEQGKVVATRRIRHLDLVLDEAPAPVRDRERAAQLLVEAATEDLDRALDLSDRSTTTLLARLELLRDAMPELELPAADETTLRDLLPELCRGKRSFEELRRTRPADVLLARLDWKQRQALDRHAPERIEVPSGSHVRITYERGRPPVLAVRIQEVFGWTETPRIAAGRVPLLLHLLAPNQRPQQVTDDLASFWRGAYHDVRKDLRRRYAKHAWPEDPLTAKAERRPRRRR